MGNYCCFGGFDEHGEAPSLGIGYHAPLLMIEAEVEWKGQHMASNIVGACIRPKLYCFDGDGGGPGDAEAVESQRVLLTLLTQGTIQWV